VISGGGIVEGSHGCCREKLTFGFRPQALSSYDRAEGKKKVSWGRRKEKTFGWDREPVKSDVFTGRLGPPLSSVQLQHKGSTREDEETNCAAERERGNHEILLEEQDILIRGSRGKKSDHKTTGEVKKFRRGEDTASGPLRKKF